MKRLAFILLVTVGLGFGQDLETRRAARAEALRVFLDQEKPKDTRLKSVKEIGYLTDEGFRSIGAILANQREDDDIRAAAARVQPTDGEFISAVVAILNDPKNGGEALKVQLITELMKRSISRLPPARREEVKDAIRRSLDDPREAVRLRAFRALVPAQDSAAIERLASSLKSAGTPLIPLVDAIELLGLSGAVNHVGVLRPYLDHEDASVRAVAALTLAIDPESRPKITTMARNKQSPAVVRIAALRGLAQSDATFASYAVPLLDDAEEPAKLRSVAMQGLVARLNYKPPPPEVQIQIAEAIERLSKASRVIGPDEDVRGAQSDASRALRYLRESLPAVREHYSRR